MTLYRIDPIGFGQFWGPEVNDLLEALVLVPVSEWCLTHNLEPIPGRGFCEQYDLDEDGIEDCHTVRVGEETL